MSLARVLLELGEPSGRLVRRGPGVRGRLARFVRLSLGGRSPRLELSHLLLEAAALLAAILLRTPRGCQLVAW